jgi:hypothetical protein
MHKQKLINPILMVIFLVTIIVILAACQPKVVGSTESPETGVAGPTATVNNAGSGSISPTSTPGTSNTGSADPNASIVEYLTNLPIPTPDFSSKQIDHPVARMNSPESLTGSGAFPDNYFTSDILHTGSRGCLSCHADLYTLVKNLSPEIHVASHPTYGKMDDIVDCKSCHDIAAGLTGPKLADIIHASHWNNSLFEDTYKGTCWSCHAVNTKNEMVLWDEVKYDASLAGYENPTSDGVVGWETARGFEKGNMIGFDLVGDLGLEIVDGK